MGVKFRLFSGRSMSRSRLAKTDLCFGNHYELIFKPVGVTFKQPTQDLNLIGSTLIFKSHKNDPSMWPPLSIYLLAKIFVICNQNPILIISFLNHLIVFRSASLIEYRKDFMSFTT